MHFGSITANPQFGYLAQVAATESQALAQLASFERRQQDWELQKALAEEDVRIGTQQVRMAEDHVRVVGRSHLVGQSA